MAFRDNEQHRFPLPVDWRKIPITVRCANVLLNGRVESPKALAKMTTKEVLKIRNCGFVTLVELSAILASQGLVFADFQYLFEVGED